MQIDTLCVHSGRAPEASTGAHAPPIHLSSTFERDADGSFSRGFDYARDANPNRNQLEDALAALELGSAAVAYASGTAAIAAIFQALEPGDHVLVTEDVYYGVRRFLDEIMARWGLRASYVDFTDRKAVLGAFQSGTRLLFAETPSNPLARISDIAALGRIAHERQAVLVCDNTWATPVLQRPLDLGADLVVHSGTKFLGGHSDAMLGVVVARDAQSALVARLRSAQRLAGAVPSPFACWLVLRSLDTLALRVRAQSANALHLARMLASRPDVEAVHYPGLEGDPGHAAARRQMHGGFGGVLSFEVSGGKPRAMAVAARLRTIVRATSFGGTHTTIEHRRSIEGPDSATPDSLLRLAVGIEAAQDIAEDLTQALDATS
jgi:cystathionine gamma-synthase